MSKQKKQYINNPITGEKMEVRTYSGHELFWDQLNQAYDTPESQSKEDFYKNWEDDRL